MNTITVEGEYKFSIDQMVIWTMGDGTQKKRQIKHRYTERFAQNRNAIARYVIWNEKTNEVTTVSEIVLRAA